MCGRFSVTKSQQEIETRFEAKFKAEPAYRKWNAAPGNRLPIIHNLESRQIQSYQWGLVPSWAKNDKIGYKTINARMETVAEKPTFKQAYQKRRCLVLADGYYEWKNYGKQKVPYRVTLSNGGLFAMAGLWELWERNGTTLQTFTIITRPAFKNLAFIHDRMPVIFRQDAERLWLANDLPTKSFASVLDSVPDENTFHFYTVSNAVNKTSENSSHLIEPFQHNIQGSLF